MFERYTHEARNAIFSARREASLSLSHQIKPEHILLALLNHKAFAEQLMNGLVPEEIRNELFTGIGGLGKEPVSVDIRLSGDAKKVLYFAAAEAEKMEEKHIGNEHLLLGLLQTEGCAAAQLLKRKGLTVENVRTRIGLHRVQVPVERRRRRSWRSLLNRMFTKADKATVVLRRVFFLARMGYSRKALSLLDDFMAEPAADGGDRTKTFAGLASNIARKMGDLPLARKYCELSIARDPKSPLPLYQLADLLDSQGEHEEARRYATQCYELAMANKDQMREGILELIEKRFPNLGPFR